MAVLSEDFPAGFVGVQLLLKVGGCLFVLLVADKSKLARRKIVPNQGEDERINDDFLIPAPSHISPPRRVPATEHTPLNET
jgi:hypothetical protein